MSCGRARNGYASQSGLYLEVTESTQILGKSRVTDLGTHQCCILATQGKIINANHVPITLESVTFIEHSGVQLQLYARPAQIQCVALSSFTLSSECLLCLVWPVSLIVQNRTVQRFMLHLF